MKDQFYVLRDKEGFFRPQVFCTRDGDLALKDVEYFKSKHKLEEGDEIIKVVFVKI